MTSTVFFHLLCASNNYNKNSKLSFLLASVPLCTSRPTGIFFCIIGRCFLPSEHYEGDARRQEEPVELTKSWWPKDKYDFWGQIFQRAVACTVWSRHVKASFCEITSCVSTEKKHIHIFKGGWWGCGGDAVRPSENVLLTFSHTLYTHWLNIYWFFFLCMRNKCACPTYASALHPAPNPDASTAQVC